MKVSVIISSVLILQTSASFFDELSGAVSSVENSFEKLLTDVVYDVKETIDCTLLAVEQVLSLGIFGEQSDYDRRCKDAPGSVAEPSISDHAPPPVQEIFTQNPIPELDNKESRQVASSAHVDEVLCDVLKKDGAHSQLKNIKQTLQNKTERLTEINDLLRKQLEGLSNEVKEKFNTIEWQSSKPSVVTIENDINILHDIEHRYKNTAESRNISHVLDQVLVILDAKGEDQTSADEEIIRKLSQNAIDGSSGLWKSADEYPKDFREYANKMFEGSRGFSSLENSSEKSEADNTKDIPKEDSNKEQPKEMTTVKPNLKQIKLITTTTTTEKALTVEELAAQYGTLFEIVPDIDSVANKKATINAKNIIEKTKLNEIFMKSLDDLESNKVAEDLFGNPRLLGAKK